MIGRYVVKRADGQYTTGGASVDAWTPSRGSAFVYVDRPTLGLSAREIAEGEADFWRRKGSDVTVYRLTRRSQLDDARAMLLRIEWVAGIKDGFEVEKCPICRGHRATGHRGSCELDGLLRKAGARTVAAPAEDG